jgi:hypothetical protein
VTEGPGAFKTWSLEIVRGRTPKMEIALGLEPQCDQGFHYLIPNWI